MGQSDQGTRHARRLNPFVLMYRSTHNWSAGKIRSPFDTSGRTAGKFKTENKMQRFISIVVLWASLAPWHAHAQWVPKMPIRIVVPFAAGGAPHISPRAPAEKITPEVAVSGIVDKPGGAHGMRGAAHVATNKP